MEGRDGKVLVEKGAGTPPPRGILLSPPPPCIHVSFFSFAKPRLRLKECRGKKKKSHVVVLKERPGSAKPSFATA